MMCLLRLLLQIERKEVNIFSIRKYWGYHAWLHNPDAAVNAGVHVQDT